MEPSVAKTEKKIENKAEKPQNRPQPSLATSHSNSTQEFILNNLEEFHYFPPPQQISPAQIQKGRIYDGQGDRPNHILVGEEVDRCVLVSDQPGQEVDMLWSHLVSHIEVEIESEKRNEVISTERRKSSVQRQEEDGIVEAEAGWIKDLCKEEGKESNWCLDCVYEPCICILTRLEERLEELGSKKPYEVDKDLREDCQLKLEVPDQAESPGQGNLPRLHGENLEKLGGGSQR